MTDNRNLATLPLIGAQSKRIQANGHGSALRLTANMG